MRGVSIDIGKCPISCQNGCIIVGLHKSIQCKFRHIEAKPALQDTHLVYKIMGGMLNLEVQKQYALIWHEDKKSPASKIALQVLYHRIS